MIEIANAARPTTPSSSLKALGYPQDCRKNKGFYATSILLLPWNVSEAPSYRAGSIPKLGSTPFSIRGAFKIAYD